MDRKTQLNLWYALAQTSKVAIGCRLAMALLITGTATATALAADARAPDAARGQVLYEQHCGACHTRGIHYRRYVAAMAGGLYIYEPFAHSLSLGAAVDARNVTGYQDFVDAAPLDLIYVADHWHLSAAPSDERFIHSAVAVGAIAENVYLYCASAGLATVVRSWFDHAALSKALRLYEHEHVVVTQTVGYPRKGMR